MGILDSDSGQCPRPCYFCEVQQSGDVMQGIKRLFDDAKRRYDNGTPSLQASAEVAKACLNKLNTMATLAPYGAFRGATTTQYHAASLGDEVSRPYVDGRFICSPDDFAETMLEFSAAIASPQTMGDNSIAIADRAIYTAVMSFCMCYDLWKRSSRKTPGTFFEVFMGGAFKVAFPQYALTKHIKIDAVDLEETDSAREPGDSDSVATDIVLENLVSGKGAVVPLKITTRERIVQPFAHQRILDSAFPGKYQSFLACISETQLDAETHSVNQICVPGTVKLYQRHLSRLAGLYYCDVPQRYGRADFQAIVPVKPLGAIFADLAKALA